VLGWRRSAAVLAFVLATSAGCTSEEPTEPLASACPSDRIEGTLEPLGMPGSIGLAEASSHSVITWLGGNRTGVVEGALSVIAPDGRVLARVGDPVIVTGGHVRPGEIVACGPVVSLRRG
jgi:hypothetical protein